MNCVEKVYVFSSVLPCFTFLNKMWLHYFSLTKWLHHIVVESRRVIILKKMWQKRRASRLARARRLWIDGADCRGGGDSGMRDQYITMF